MIFRQPCHSTHNCEIKQQQQRVSCGCFHDFIYKQTTSTSKFQHPKRRFLFLLRSTMSSLTSVEQWGIKDLLGFYSEDPSIGFDLAKVVCKNLIIPNSPAEAIDLILLHSPSVSSILNRKAITKGALFKYLHARRVPVNAELSKSVLIEKTIGHWTDTFPTASSRGDQHDAAEPNESTERLGKEITVDADLPENFPIHRMSRLFTGWFFRQYNSGELCADDFWCDAHCRVDLLDAAAGGSSCSETTAHQQESADGADVCAAMLLALRDRYTFYFNVNECHAGCQGRVDAHGLVMVLSCGTLHVQQRFVGCWECAFGLVRDPFTDNNWKVKHMQLRLRSVATTTTTTMTALDDAAARMPELADCETLRGMLALPASEMDLG